MKPKNELTNIILTFTAGIIPVAFLLLTTAGCGSTKVATHTTTQATVGQQLMDLKNARDQGLINDKEYEKLREAIVEKNE
jgi:hypothetical protein